MNAEIRRAFITVDIAEYTAKKATAILFDNNSYIWLFVEIVVFGMVVVVDDCKGPLNFIFIFLQDYDEIKWLLYVFVNLNICLVGLLSVWS